jgi:hypothetical protein
MMDNTQQVISLDVDTTIDDWTDIWSMAYHEAITSFSIDLQKVILQGKNFEELLQKLQDADDTHKEQSIFRRGLDNLKGPLDKCKLVLDFTEPFLSMEPTAKTAVGVVQSVTTVRPDAAGLII